MKPAPSPERREAYDQWKMTVRAGRITTRKSGRLHLSDGPQFPGASAGMLAMTGWFAVRIGGSQRYTSRLSGEG